VTASGEALYELPVGVELTKGNYVLSLLTHYGQASGVIGGRLGEIGQIVFGVPSLTECFGLVEEPTQIADRLERVDLLFDTGQATAETKSDCGNPQERGVLWYGSYFRQICTTLEPTCQGGYFLDYLSLAGAESPFGDEAGTSYQMAYGLRYDAASADSLPTETDPGLHDILEEASTIVAGISYIGRIPRPDIYDAIRGIGEWITESGAGMALSDCSDQSLYPDRIYYNVLTMHASGAARSPAEIDALRDKIGTIATNSGWQRCNALSGETTCSPLAAGVGKCSLGEVFAKEYAEVYLKGSELMNIKTSLGQKPGWLDSIVISFSDEQEYVQPLEP
jgi:hypothetical protein